MNMDIVYLLRDYVELLEKSGIARTSAESQLMTAAADEIENLRKSRDFYMQLADDYNRSRLAYMDRELERRKGGETDGS